MKRRIFVSALALCILAVFAFFAIPAAAGDSPTKAKTVENNVLTARFLNMLNRNFVYDAEFEDADAVTENSILALIDRRDAANPEYISEAVVKGFVYDMYGIEIIDINEDDSVHKEGFVYIVPRGFTSFQHKITDIKENEDGSFTVVSDVTVYPHDDESYVTQATTLFVKNTKSAFGYNIISSDIKDVADCI